MATTSEIQVTEAYIGLLGRAPDPAGLAYWAAQLDAAIAAGEDATVALKKLTNDITLSAEWTAGIGANDASTQSGADAIVTAMYTNLFAKTATTADKAYWSAELVAGTTTASEMAVQLIAGASTTDAATLALKQEAATYYVETVVQADFNKTNAASAVSSVDSPLTLQTSKDATDALASGTGNTTALTTGTDTATMTLGDDTATGVVGTGATFAAVDSIVDASTIDSDTVTLTGDNGFNSGTITNVEAINLSLSRQNGAAFDINDVSNITGSTINLTVSEKVTIAGIEVDGETEVDLSTGGAANLDALVSNLNTVNVTKLTAIATDTGTNSAGITISGDADLATVVLSGIDANDTAITTANNDSTITLDGTTATNDAVSVTGVGKVALDLENGGGDNSEVEEVTLAGSGGAVTFTVTNADEAAGVTKYTTAGDQAITLAGAAAQFDGAVITQGGTGTLGFSITTAGDLDATGLTVAGGISLAADVGANNTDTIKAPSGTTVSIDTAQTASSVLTLDANDTLTTSTLVINANEATGELLTEDYDTVTINTNDSKAITIDEIDMDANDTAVSVGGSNDVTVTNAAVAGGDLSIVGLDISLAAATATKGDLTISASGGAAATGTLTAQNDISITATNDVDLVATTTTNAGFVTVTGNDIDATDAFTLANGNLTLETTGSRIDIEEVAITAGGMTATSATGFDASAAIAATNDVTITATQEVVLDSTVTTSLGNVALSGNDVTISGAITATAGNVTITATNDSATSDINATVTAGGSVTIADGKFDADGQKIEAQGGGGIIISGDAQLAGTGATLEGSSVTITSTSNQLIASLAEVTSTQGVVLSAAAATGNITVAGVTTAATGLATLVTGSGTDAITINDGNVTTAITSGKGVDTITLTNIAATGSSVNTGEGDDAITVGAITTTLTVNAGAGDDSLTLLGDTTGGTVDMGDGTADTIVLDTGDYSLSSGPLAMTNVEKVDITAGDATFDWSQLSGNDVTFELKGNNVTDELVIDGGSTGDTIDLTGITSNALAPAAIKVNAGNGTNVITGAESLINTIVGGTGVDTITGGDGADDLGGGNGNDTINGGIGTDAINGGDGTDTIDGGAGVDTVTTGATGSTPLGTAVSIATSGIDTVAVTTGDIFDFGGTEALSTSGGGDIAITLDDDVDDSTFTELLAAMDAAVNADLANLDAVLFNVTDTGDGGSNSLAGFYLVHATDDTISDDDAVILLTGTGLDGNTAISIVGNNVVLTI